MIAAQVPHLDDVIVQKHQMLEHPDTVKLYRIVSDALDWSDDDDSRVVEVVDLLESMMIASVRAGATGSYDLDDDLVHLMDSAMLESAPRRRGNPGAPGGTWLERLDP